MCAEWTPKWMGWYKQRQDGVKEAVYPQEPTVQQCIKCSGGA
jgi:hypothetical protein